MGFLVWVGLRFLSICQTFSYNPCGEAFKRARPGAEAEAV